MSADSNLASGSKWPAEKASAGRQGISSTAQIAEHPREQQANWYQKRSNPGHHSATSIRARLMRLCVGLEWGAWATTGEKERSACVFRVTGMLENARLGE
jgi:hypothetical protein